MGLLSIIRKQKRKEKEMRILMLYVYFVHLIIRGLDNAGKTTILKKFLNEDINTISPTLGFKIHSVDYKSYKRYINEFNNRYHLNIWDIGGQKTIRNYWRNYYEEVSIFLFYLYIDRCCNLGCR